MHPSILKLFVMTTLLLIATSFKQTNNELAFSMTPPSGWHGTTNQEIWDNLHKFKVTGVELNKYISDHKGSLLVVSYMKYKPSEHAGLIPVIQVNLRLNDTKSFSQFVSVMTKSADNMKNYLNDFQYVDNAKTITLAGRQAFYFSAKFNMLTKNSDTIKARSRTYAVPIGDKFLQINFTDGPNEDCSKLFDSLVKTIKFN